MGSPLDVRDVNDSPGAPARRERGREPTCPRCGYDLSGHVSAWNTPSPTAWGSSCPLDGQCSECGLAFAWREVLSPMHAAPAWSFEHGACPRSALATMRRMALPWRFWREMGLHHPVRPKRLLALLVGVGIVSQIALSLVAGALSYGRAEAMSSIQPRFPATPRDFAVGAIGPHIDWRWVDKALTVSPWSMLVVLAWALPLLLFLALGDTLCVAKVRFSHLLRIGVLSLIVAILYVQGDAALWWLEEYQSSVNLAARRGVTTGLLTPRVPVELARPSLALLFLSWLALWWWGAIATYMRLSRPRMVFLVMHGTAMFGTGVLYLSFLVWIVH